MVEQNRSLLFLDVLVSKKPYGSLGHTGSGQVLVYIEDIQGIQSHQVPDDGDRYGSPETLVSFDHLK
jgi:hypothetical protein